MRPKLSPRPGRGLSSAAAAEPLDGSNAACVVVTGRSQRFVLRAMPNRALPNMSAAGGPPGVPAMANFAATLAHWPLQRIGARERAAPHCGAPRPLRCHGGCADAARPARAWMGRLAEAGGDRDGGNVQDVAGSASEAAVGGERD